MPRYSLPPVKQSRDDDVKSAGLEEDDFPSRWEREIRIPVNQAIIEAVKAGSEVEVTLRGKVSGVESHEHEETKHNRRTVTIDLTDVEIYDEDPEDAMDRGHRRATRGNRY